MLCESGLVLEEHALLYQKKFKHRAGPFDCHCKKRTNNPFLSCFSVYQTMKKNLESDSGEIEQEVDSCNLWKKADHVAIHPEICQFICPQELSCDDFIYKYELGWNFKVYLIRIDLLK